MIIVGLAMSTELEAVQSTPVQSSPVPRCTTALWLPVVAGRLQGCSAGGVHRKTQTQNLGQLNPETKGKKNNFGADFETHSKTRFEAS